MRHNGLSYVHTGGDEPLTWSTVDAYFKSVVEKHGDREAVVSLHQDVRVTYRELDERVERAARGLLHLGVRQGDRVAIWSTNNLEWLLVQLATARVGAILVNLNPAHKLSELRHALQLAEVNVLFLMPSFKSSRYVDMALELMPVARECRPDRLEPQLFQNLHRVVVIDPMDLDRTERWAPGFLTWREFLDGGGAVTKDSIEKRSGKLDPDDPINIQFTSGTTGFPKAVVLTHHNIVNNAYFTGRELRLTEQDRLCVPVPFFHCFGMVVSNLACLTHGGCIVIPGGHFEPATTLRAIRDEKCTAVHGVPTMFVAELEAPEFRAEDMTSLRSGIMAGAPCPPELMRRVMEDMGCTEILIGYGQTECSPIACLTRPSDSVKRRLETVGSPIPHQECKIVDTETDATLPIGEQGEVCFRGYHVMREYYGQKDETRKAIDSAGWLHSGDLGVMDADGYVAITGRLKDMIIRGGENIYPAEIEAFYHTHPDVEDIAVVGVPDEKMGEEVGAWVKFGNGSKHDAESMKAFAKGNIAHFKVPRLFWFVDEFPQTATGKIQKTRMRDAVERWRAAGGESAPNPIESYVR